MKIKKLGLSFVFIFISCKVIKEPTSDSELQTIDNLTAGSVKTLNSCEANPKQLSSLDAILSAAPARELRIGEKRNATLKKTLAVLPARMLSDFLDYASIEAVSDVANVCGFVGNKKSKDLGEDEIKSCWILDDNDEFKVIVSDQEQHIRHSAVRAVLYFVFEVLIDVGVEGGNTITKETRDAEFIAAQEKLVKAYLDEVTTLNQAAAIRLESHHDLNTAVLSEVLDSKYCSDASRKNLKNFPVTQEIFEKGVGIQISETYEESSQLGLWYGRVRSNMASRRYHRANMAQRWGFPRVAAHHRRVGNYHSRVAQRRYHRHTAYFGNRSYRTGGYYSRIGRYRY